MPQSEGPISATTTARAVDLLTKVVVRCWDSRFADIELPAPMELNCILARARSFGVKADGLDPKLLRLLTVDLRLVMTWDVDGANVRLVVREPSGAKLEGDGSRSQTGGLIGGALTGNGPEEYLLRQAVHGKYLIQATRLCVPEWPLSGRITPPVP